MTFTYKGVDFTIDQPALWCNECGEGIINAKDKVITIMISSGIYFYTHNVSISLEKTIIWHDLLPSPLREKSVPNDGFSVHMWIFA